MRVPINIGFITVTHDITQQISLKLLRMDVLTSETCWALNNETKKQVTSSWSLFIQQSWIFGFSRWGLFDQVNDYQLLTDDSWSFLLFQCLCSAFPRDLLFCKLEGCRLFSPKRWWLDTRLYGVTSFIHLCLGLRISLVPSVLPIKYPINLSALPFGQRIQPISSPLI